jgi:acyl-CoA thioester hydrolase
MPVPMPTLDQVRELPALLTLTIPVDWQDSNGHVNLQYYLRIFDLCGKPLTHILGIGTAEILIGQLGYFNLEHHLWNLAEMHVGDTVCAHFRFLRSGTKRFHGLMFIVNQSRASLAAVLEFVTTGADLRTRRTSELPAAVAQELARLIDQHSQLAWTAPVCGAIAP